MFLKVLIIILGVYFLGKMLVRGVVSYFLGDVNERMNDRIRRQQDEALRQKKKEEGQVTVNYQPKQNKNFAKDDGDYVDFEEV